MVKPPAREPARRDVAATGMPAPFTQEQVDGLIRGALDETEASAVLEAHERTLPKPTRRPRKVGPVDISAGDLDVLARGEMPERVLRSLERAEKKDVPARRRTIRGARPRTKPKPLD